MKVLIAGASGALGTPTARALLDAGHEVFGLTRSETKSAELTRAGVKPVVGDVYDAARMKEVVASVAPEGMLQFLNAIPKNGAFKLTDLDETNRLRTEGTNNLLSAALDAGVKRYVVESMIFGYGYSMDPNKILDESAPFAEKIPAPEMAPALNALKDMERMVLGASSDGLIEGIVLRYGLFYGPRVGSSRFIGRMLKRRMMALPGGGVGVASWIRVEDGAAAARVALEKAPSGSVYNVVDDQPASLREMTHEMARALNVRKPWNVPLWLVKPFSPYAATIARAQLRVSNAKIKRDLGWEPRFPTYKEGLAEPVEL